MFELNWEQRNNVKTIEKRIVFLRKRIKERVNLGAQVSFDKTELDALEWCLETLEQYFGGSDGNQEEVS